MNSKQASKTINDKIFISENKEPKCILIDGKWGIGKTYSIKNLKESKGNNFKYISLFGKDDIRKVEKDLILQIQFNINKCVKKNKNIIPEMIINGIKNFTSESKLSLDLNTYLDNISIENLQEKDIIICIDDIERKSKEISIEKLLGLSERISSKFNLILIGNISKLDSEEEKLFNEFKEKVIDIELVIDTLDDNQIKSIIKESVLKKYFEDSNNSIEESSINEIINVFKSKENICNIRVLNKFIDLLNKVNEEISKIMDKDRFWLNSVIISSCYRVISKKYLNCSNNSRGIDDQIEKIMNFDNYDKEFLKDLFDHNREVIMDSRKLSNAYKLNDHQLNLLIEDVISKINSSDLNYFTKQEDVIHINDELYHIFDDNNHKAVDQISNKLLEIATKLYEPCLNKGLEIFSPGYINWGREVHKTTLNLKDSIECKNIDLYTKKLQEDLKYKFKTRNYLEYKNTLIKNLLYKDILDNDEFFYDQFKNILDKLEEEFFDDLWDCAYELVRVYNEDIINKYMEKNKELSLLTKIRIKQLSYI